MWFYSCRKKSRAVGGTCRGSEIDLQQFPPPRGIIASGISNPHEYELAASKRAGKRGPSKNTPEFQGGERAQGGITGKEGQNSADGENSNQLTAILLYGIYLTTAAEVR
ncbi:unnamed protein product [Pylaiella littoralis]